MIPIKNTQTVDKNPTKTYFLDIDAGRISGNVDGILAMKQAIYLILRVPSVWDPFLWKS